jgi:hypothetical protein
MLIDAGVGVVRNGDGSGSETTHQHPMIASDEKEQIPNEYRYGKDKFELIMLKSVN